MIPFWHRPTHSFAVSSLTLIPNISSLPLTEAAAVAELQHADGGGGRPQQQLHLSSQRHAEPHQRGDQQGAVAATALSSFCFLPPKPNTRRILPLIAACRCTQLISDIEF